MHSRATHSRQAFLLERLRAIKPTSVFDVACGDGKLIEALAICCEEIPVETLCGLERSLELATIASRRVNMAAQSEQQGLGRWRNLDTKIMYGITPILFTAYIGRRFDTVKTSPCHGQPI
jgi:trans-aconitate methyltransferase